MKNTGKAKVVLCVHCLYIRPQDEETNGQCWLHPSFICGLWYRHLSAHCISAVSSP